MYIIDNNYSESLVDIPKNNFSLRNTNILDEFSQFGLNKAIFQVQDLLKTIASKESFLSTINLAFGNNFNQEKLEALRQEWITQDYTSIPTIEIRSRSEINGANGAFSSTTNRIYIAQEYITANIDHPQMITDVFLEEIGHFIDAQINSADSFGDEGAIFSALAQGKTLDESHFQLLKAEDDTATINLDGQLIQIEQQSNEKVTISGTILWKDSTGKKSHPVREALVYIAKNNKDNNVIVKKLRTDSNGIYSSTFNFDQKWKDRNFYIAVYANGPGYYVTTKDGTTKNTYGLASPISVIPDDKNSLTINYSVGNVKIDQNAFSVNDALYVGGVYAKTVGAKLTQKLKTTFPAPATEYIGNNIKVEAGDYSDWDVILHEYGHFLAEQDNLSNGPGGAHNPYKSNITTRGKDEGVRLGWDEGLASYLSIAAQFVAARKKQLPNIPGVKDTSLSGIFDLESGSTNSPQGESDEVAVARILWDIADANKDNRDDIALSHEGLYKTLKQIKDLDRLDDLWDHFQEKYYPVNGNKNAAELVKYGDIFEQNSVSPSPNLINGKSFNKEEIPTFSWQKQNNNANDEFQVLIFDATLSKPILKSQPDLKGTSWKPSEKEWSKIEDGIYNLVVTGTDTDGEDTGAYWSGARTFGVNVTLSYFDWYGPFDYTDHLLGQSMDVALVGNDIGSEIGDQLATNQSNISSELFPSLSPPSDSNLLQDDVVSLGMSNSLTYFDSGLSGNLSLVDNVNSQSPLSSNGDILFTGGNSSVQTI